MEAVDPELYAQMSKFTVKGAVNETVTAEINVLVVDGDSIQLEQLPDTHADSIMGDRSTSDGPSILITHEEPTDSYQWGAALGRTGETVLRTLMPGYPIPGILPR
ncbi:MAG: hypothetical protein ACLTC4_20125 [Hungatella hathewayi]